jgi:phosphatidylglycerol:prolipoprotein diacylglycerol transferase
MYDHFPGMGWPTPYGVMLALACLAAWWLARRRAAAAGLDPSHLDLALPLAFAGGGFAARALGAIVPGERLLAGTAFLAEERWRLPALAMAGLPILFVYCRIAHLSFRRVADAVAPAALVWIAILRIGCFLAGCCFGDVVGHTDRLAFIADPSVRLQLQTLPALSPGWLPYAVHFPPGSFAYRQQLALGLIDPGAAASLPLHPVQLYESALLLLLALALLRPGMASRPAGTLALLATGGFAGLAIALDFLRADNALLLGPLTGNQLIYFGWLAALLPLAASARARVR